MKKVTLSFLALAMAAGLANAQTLDSIVNHPQGFEHCLFENVMQMDDGNVLFNLFVSHTLEDCAGDVLYKVSRHGASIMDTLFVEDQYPPFFLFAKNPTNGDNIRVGIVHDAQGEGGFLEISPFDNELYFDSSKEIVVPLTDNRTYSFWRGQLINKNNELVFNFLTPDGNNGYDLNFACFGLDGSLKHANKYPFSYFEFRDYCGFQVYDESPLEYLVYGVTCLTSTLKMDCFVFDTLFQLKDSFTLYQEGPVNPQNPPMQFTMDGLVSPCLLVDGDDFVVGTRYSAGVNNGVCVVRYDKRTRELKNEAYFPSVPMISNGPGATHVGLGKAPDGSLYFSYNTQSVSYQPQVAVVKMDADLNVIWQRFCLDPGFVAAQLMLVLDDGGIAVCGYHQNPEVFFLVLDDEGWGVPEQEDDAALRPYAYYPNPVEDRLHLQYSPDVTPAQIELYDLQGRLVRTQRSGLESLGMEGLAAGAYTMRVTLDDGKTFTDKVVKE